MQSKIGIISIFIILIYLVVICFELPITAVFMPNNGYLYNIYSLFNIHITIFYYYVPFIS